MKQLLSILCAFFATALFAAEMNPSAYDQAQGCSKGNQREMNECISRSYAESDARLKVLYRYFMKALNDPGSLKKAQVAWLRYRDLQCAFEVPPSWQGSGVQFSRDICIIGLTEQRIAELERIEPCNGCVEFKPEFYEYGKFKLPPR